MKCEFCGSELEETYKYCCMCGKPTAVITLTEHIQKKVKIKNHNYNSFELTLENCEFSKITDYKLESLAHGGTRLNLTIELDNASVLIETSAN